MQGAHMPVSDNAPYPSGFTAAPGISTLQGAHMPVSDNAPYPSGLTAVPWLSTLQGAHMPVSDNAPYPSGLGITTGNPTNQQQIYLENYKKQIEWLRDRTEEYSKQIAEVLSAVDRKIGELEKESAAEEKAA
jgi:hypothetical protein